MNRFVPSFFYNLLWRNLNHPPNYLSPSRWKSNLKKINTRIFQKKNMNNLLKKWNSKKNKMKLIKFKEDKTLITQCQKRGKKSKLKNNQLKIHPQSLSRKTPSHQIFFNGSKSKYKDQLPCLTHQNTGHQLLNKK